MTRTALFSLAIFSAIARASQLPNGWKACRLSDAERRLCLTEATASALSDLMDGNEILGINPVDPLIIPRQNISQGDFKLILNNVKVTGLKRTRVDSIETDWTTLRILATIPEVIAVGLYRIDGTFKTTPLGSEGDVELVAGGLKVDFRLKFSEKDSGGILYNHIDESALALDIDALHVKFDNQREEITKEMNADWKYLWTIIKLPLENSWRQLLTHLASAIFRQVPKSELSPN